MRLSIFTSCLLALLPSSTIGFTVSRLTPLKSVHSTGTRLDAESIDGLSIATDETVAQDPNKVSSLLKFIGPYPSLGLRFPDLATQSQKERNITGISLDFVIDTAANTNTINAQVATELGCESVGSALPGYSAAGALDGGDTFLLGNCTLDMPNKELFMTDLTASALPVASPATAGLLGVGFLNCFEGGVKFEWGGGVDSRQSMVTFHGEDSGIEEQLKRMTRVPIDVIDQILLPSVTMNINGAKIPALLDTGSPVTVLNSAAAELAGLTTVVLENDGIDDEKGGFNPFKKIADNFKAAQSLSQAASQGDVLVVGGSDGQRIELWRTEEKAQIFLGPDEAVSFPSTNIFVGDLPGLKALEGLNDTSSTPAAVLGMDVLKRKGVMVYRGMQNEVYF